MKISKELLQEYEQYLVLVEQRVDAFFDSLVFEFQVKHELTKDQMNQLEKRVWK